MRLKKDFISKKVFAINSDLSERNLALSDSDRQDLIKKISIVFHVAASVKFEAPLEVNMRHNVVATKELLEFACNFEQLLCFIHVSTAYSNCQLRQIDERIYPMAVPEDPMSIKVTKDMIDSRPNTYTFTKAMAENVASQYASRMNIVIVRPSIVMSSLNEPSEGWVDTINGPVGLSVLGALGILQKIKVNSEVVFDLIPVDIVTNALVTIAWATTEKKSKFLPDFSFNDDGNENRSSSSNTNDNKNNNNDTDGSVRVFNLTTGSENPCSFYHYFSTGREEALNKPSARALRPLLTIPKQKGMNPTQYYIYKIFSHLLFAYIIDTLLSLFGQKKMVVKAVNKMHHANEVFDYFCSNQWTFITENVRRLREMQAPLDRDTFNCDVRAINWKSYAQIGWLGCRRFILKEDDSTIDNARRRYKMICFMYYLVKMLIILSLTLILNHFISSKIFLSMLILPVYSAVYLL